jgi:hypothetical protein
VGHRHFDASLNPVSEVSLRYPWTDTNRDTFVQRSELDLTRLLNRTGNYDPANPSSPVSSTTVDRISRTIGRLILCRSRTRADGELRRGRGVNLSHVSGLRELTTTNGVRSEDYVPATFTANCGNTNCDQPS